MMHKDEHGTPRPRRTQPGQPLSQAESEHMTADEAEEFIRSSGVAELASLEGVAAVKQAPAAFHAMQEVTGRFGLDPLGSIGPVSRFYRERPRGVNALLYAEAERADIGSTGHLHIPIKFGSLKEMEEQHRTSMMMARDHQAERDKELEDPAPGVSIDRDAAKAAAMVGKGYGWTVSSMLPPAMATVSITYHECGHMLHLLSAKIGERINAVMDDSQAFERGWSLSLSKYAGENRKEMVADSFALYMFDPSQHFRIHPGLLGVFQKFDALS